MTNLTNNVAIVTGANREIGAAMAETLAGAGASVLVVHYGEAERAAVTVARIAERGGRALAHEADLRSVAENERMVARAVAAFGRVDIFVANAGLTINRPFLETRAEDWDTLLDLNLKGSFFGAQFAAKQIIAQGGGGQIVFSSSVTGVKAIPGLAAYGVTKAALRHMAATLAVELGAHGITVNALGIGATLNERNLADDPDYAAHWAGVLPVGRIGQPQDVASVLLFLVSPAAAMVTGQTIILDGGWSLQGRMP